MTASAHSRARRWSRRGGVATALLVGLLTFAVVSAQPARGAPRFPAPDRPVPAVVSAEYSTEPERDAKGEADRVMAQLGIRPGLRVADIGAGLGYYTVRLARRLGSTGSVYASDRCERAPSTMSSLKTSSSAAADAAISLAFMVWSSKCEFVFSCKSLTGLQESF